MIENERVALIKQKIGEDISTFSTSPFAKWMGGKLIAVEEGMVEIEIIVREDMCNPMMIFGHRLMAKSVVFFQLP